eukprot:gnl/Dysnectes_brevis/2366_a2795_1177.p1 GENE.gnl/Dysnectes_brevis/2366_a2795_1177~~gnl/Dysnectes_brevis/2366_a2795_1177.p1  ORF type:complete len:422 (-),score=94.23 gnl/Dysnectes_brevis/2366_a2795_1177:1664-2929(-)
MEGSSWSSPFDQMGTGWRAGGGQGPGHLKTGAGGGAGGGAAAGGGGGGSIDFSEPWCSSPDPLTSGSAMSSEAFQYERFRMIMGRVTRIDMAKSKHPALSNILIMSGLSLVPQRHSQSDAQTYRALRDALSVSFSVDNTMYTTHAFVCFTIFRFLHVRDYHRIATDCRSFAPFVRGGREHTYYPLIKLINTCAKVLRNVPLALQEEELANPSAIPHRREFGSEVPLHPDKGLEVLAELDEITARFQSEQLRLPCALSHLILIDTHMRVGSYRLALRHSKLALVYSEALRYYGVFFRDLLVRSSHLQMAVSGHGCSVYHSTKLAAATIEMLRSGPSTPSMAGSALMLLHGARMGLSLELQENMLKRLELHHPDSISQPHASGSSHLPQPTYTPTLFRGSGQDVLGLLNHVVMESITPDVNPQ